MIRVPWQSAVDRPALFRLPALYTNSLFLMANTSILAVLGYLFWLIAARLYGSNEVGVAAAEFSAMTYVAQASQLGLNVGLLRYLGTSVRVADRVTASLTAVTAIGAGLSCVVGLVAWTLGSGGSSLSASAGSLTIFALLSCLAALALVTESVFIALRRSRYILATSLLLGSGKIVPLAFVAQLGTNGLLLSWMLGSLASVVVTVAILVRSHLLTAVTSESLRSLNGMVRYSLVNYIGALIGSLPLALLPIIVVARASPEAGAYVQVAMSYAALLFSVPLSICRALFAERASGKADVGHEIRRAVILLSGITLVGSAMLVLLRLPLLRLFGDSYAVAAEPLLILLALSAPFIAINTLCWTLLNLRNGTRQIVFALSINALLVGAGTYFRSGDGLYSVGLVWLISQVITSVIYAVLTFRRYSGASAT